MYYPKSQIQSNQYTTGNELMVVRTKENYVGFYYTVSNGKAFAGKEPNGFKSEELMHVVNNAPSISNDNENYVDENYFIEDSSYYKAKPKTDFPIVPRNPISSFPINPKKDFKRYFASKTNEIKFIEISKTEYSKFKEKSSEVNWTLYTPIEIDWKVEGTREEVYLKNKETVHKTLIPGFDLYFREKYDKFWFPR